MESTRINNNWGCGVIDEHSVIKQLMSDIKKPKVRKVIMFTGEKMHRSRTIYEIQDTSRKDGVPIKDNFKVTKVGRKAILHQCQYCNKEFGNLKAYREHSTAHEQIFQNNLKCCDICGRTFKSEDKFSKHMAGHNDPELECPKCFKVLQTKYTLRKHITLMHNKELVCPNCTLSFDDQVKLERHILRYHTTTFSCSYCKKSFKSIDALQAHKTSHIMSTCKICKAVFSTDEEYSKHLDEHSLDEFITEDDIPVNIDSMDISLSDIDLSLFNDSTDLDPIIQNILDDESCAQQGNSRVCIICKKKFSRRSDFKRHLIEHVVKRSLAKTHIHDDGKFSIVCEICHVNTFSKLDTYKAHLRDHAELTSYTCLLCNKSFSDSSNFSKHKKYHGESRYECNLCKKTFNSHLNMQTHLQWHVKT